MVSIHAFGLQNHLYSSQGLNFPPNTLKIEMVSLQRPTELKATSQSHPQCLVHTTLSMDFLVSFALTI